MMPDTRLDLVAGNWGHGGICATRTADGQVVLLRGAIPGERVVAQVTQERRNFLRADVVEVITPSSDRVDYPLAAQVGGLELAHVAPAAARLAKAQVLGAALTHQAGLDRPVQVLPAGDGTITGWRTKVDLDADAEGRLGMHAARSRRVVAMELLPMARPAIQALGLTDRRFEPHLRVTAVAPSAGEAFWVAGSDLADPAQPLRRESVRVGERQWSYRVAARGFWQAHHLAPGILVQAILERLGGVAGDTVWDLYAGAGLFTAPLAAAVGPSGRVVAVESDRVAHRDAQANAAGLDQVRLVLAPADKALGGGFRLARPRAVVLDPPRAGAGAKVVAGIVQARPQTVVYVSCEPSTLARDLAQFQDAGFEVTDVAAWDLFPGTAHVEAMVTLRAAGRAN